MIDNVKKCKVRHTLEPGSDLSASSSDTDKRLCEISNFSLIFLKSLFFFTFLTLRGTHKGAWDRRYFFSPSTFPWSKSWLRRGEAGRGGDAAPGQRPRPARVIFSHRTANGKNTQLSSRRGQLRGNDLVSRFNDVVKIISAGRKQFRPSQQKVKISLPPSRKIGRAREIL